MAAGCGLPIIKLHIALKSKPQLSIGPSGVAAQSMLLANCICLGRAADIGSRVQSKKELSGYLACITSVVIAIVCAAIMACFGKLPSSSSSNSELEIICSGEDPAVDVTWEVVSPK